MLVAIKQLTPETEITVLQIVKLRAKVRRPPSPLLAFYMHQLCAPCNRRPGLHAAHCHEQADELLPIRFAALGSALRVDSRRAERAHKPRCSHHPVRDLWRPQRLGVPAVVSAIANRCITTVRCCRLGAASIDECCDLLHGWWPLCQVHVHILMAALPVCCRGDNSPEFRFATFFPAPMHPVVDRVAGAASPLLSRLGLAASGTSPGTAAASSMPAATSAEASRRR